MERQGATELLDAARGVLEPLGYEVLETTVSRKGRTPRLLVRIDRADEAAVTVDDVRIASEAFGLELDRLDPFEGRYALEVESPGSTRPLRTPRHFARFHDLAVDVRTRDGRVRAVVRDVDGDRVTFERDGERFGLDVADIQDARLAEWPDEPR